MFLQNSGLIATIDNLRYTITPVGKDFLQWMTLEGASDAKAAWFSHRLPSFSIHNRRLPWGERFYGRGGGGGGAPLPATGWLRGL